MTIRFAMAISFTSVSTYEDFMITTLLFFGMFWGLIEAFLGGMLHLTHLPSTGVIMSSIGFTLLFMALRAGIKPSQLVIVSLIAAAFKGLDALLFGLPLLHQTIVNPATAIAAQGLAAALLFKNSTEQQPLSTLSLRTFGAVALSMVLFNAISYFGFGWQTFHTKDPFAALVHLGLTTPLTILAIRTSEHLATTSLLPTTPRMRTLAASICLVLALGARWLLH